MVKSFRKIMISVLLLASILFVGLSFTMLDLSIVKADTTLDFVEAKQTLIDVYGGGTLRSEYNITFDKNIFDDTVPVGAVVASTNEKYPVSNKIEDFNTFINSVKINKKTTLAEIIRGCAVAKVSENTMKLITGATIGYAEFIIPAGTVINGFTIAEELNLYQQRDGSFSTTPYETFEVFSAFERPQANTSLIWLDVWCTESIGGYNWDSLNNILVNGNKIGAIKANCGGHYDKGENMYAFRIDLNITELNKLDGDKILLTFPKGFDISKNRATAKDTTFIGSKSADRAWRDLMPVWYNDSVVVSVKDVKKTSSINDADAKYSIEFESVVDLFNKNQTNSDITEFLKSSNFFESVMLNGNSLTELAKGKNITAKKLAVNKLEIKISDFVPMMSNIKIKSGLRINGRILAENKIYDLGSEIERTTLTSIKSVEKCVTYGSYTKYNQTRFVIHLENLGFFADKANGEDLSAFTTDDFYKNIFVNGSSLFDIKNVQKRAIQVFKGSNEKSIRENYDVNDAIEIIIGSCVLFDYDVEVKSQFMFADLYLEKDYGFHIDSMENFVPYVSSAETKVISIREIPDGRKNTSNIRFVFNKAVDLKNEPDFVNGILLNGVSITSENTPVHVLGGKYINPELEFGRRYYTVLMNKAEWTEFIGSENPEISISSKGLKDNSETVAVNMKLQNGVWVDSEFKGEYLIPEIVKITHPGNQTNDKKLIQIFTNVGFDHWSTPGFIKENLFINGKKVTAYPYGAGYVNPELKWNCNSFAIWIDDNIRNYDGGVDILHISKGIPISGGRIISEDVYYYGVINYDDRDGAGNWRWNFSSEMPELKLLKGDSVELSGDKYTSVILFDRVVAKNDKTLGVYNDKDLSVESLLKINGLSISELGEKASYTWIDNGIKVSVDKSVLENGIITYEFANGFKTPLGYTFNNDSSISYSVDGNVWAKNFDKENIEKFKSITPEFVSAPEIIRFGDHNDVDGIRPKAGYKVITIKYPEPIVGTLKFSGSANVHDILRNITAPLSELVELTRLGYLSDPRGLQYEYRDYVVERIISIGIQDSILDGLKINGESIRNILLRETNKVPLENYPIAVDLHIDELRVYIQEDSVIYNDIKDGFYITVSSGMIFENNNRNGSEIAYKYIVDKDTNEGTYQKFTYVKSITVKNKKGVYNQGEDLDLTKIIAYTVNNDDTRGDDFSVTEQMISGYDKNKVGEQTITVTAFGKTATFNVTVVENIVPDQPEKAGCGGNISGNLIVFALAIFVFALADFIKHKGENE